MSDTEVNIEERIPSWAVNPQKDCPLFNGRIPAEMRIQIFRDALTMRLTGRVDHDFRVRYSHEYKYLDDDLSDAGQEVNQKGDDDLQPSASSIGPGNEQQINDTDDAGHEEEEHQQHSDGDNGYGDNGYGDNGDEDDDDDDDGNQSYSSEPSFDYYSDCNEMDWARPGYEGEGYPEATVSLLQTCRRAYLEGLPLFLKNERYAWFYRMPHGCPNWNPCPPNTSLARLTSLHMFTQMYWLEALANNRGRVQLDNIEHLQITIRKGDWWNNETNQPLYITPFGGGLVGMKNQIAASKARVQISNNGGGGDSLPSWYPATKLARNAGWGRIFSSMPAIKTLTMDFDTSYDKKNELEEIAHWAQKEWRFPLNPNRHYNGCHYLDAAGVPIKKMSWRGLPTHWSKGCSNCSVHRQHSRIRHCSHCARFVRLYIDSLGPRIFTWTVTWTARKHDGMEVYPYGEDLFED
jgi:hypothetical protein